MMKPIHYLILMLLCVIVALGAAYIGSKVLPVHLNVPTPQIYTIEYVIDGGAARVDVTYTNAQGGTEQQNNVSVPFSIQFAAEPGQFLYISAQNQGKLGKTVCHILVDRIEVRTSTSSGEYAIATCSGRL